MIFGFLTLATALIISISAAVYSILGLTAIFAAAFWPIVVLGGSLEFGKIVTTLWLHKYWNQAEMRYKIYLSFAVGILMLMTSMGVFGFLSKAHLDQAVPSGDVAAKVQIIDEKIKTERDNIEAARKALAQMDASIDQTLGRSTTEQGADKAVAIRRSQARERTALQNEIASAQKKIAAYNEERAPIASELRKVEAEVGPIKYIAALIYGDNPEADVLEKAVRWVIILIVIVFDPLALTLLLAATKTFEWEGGLDLFNPKKRKEEEQVAEEKKSEPEPDISVINQELAEAKEPKPLETTVHVIEPEPDVEAINKEFAEAEEVKSIENIVHVVEPEPEVTYQVVDDADQEEVFVSPNAPGLDVSNERPGDYLTPAESPLNKVLADAERVRNTDNEVITNDIQHKIMQAWKNANPGETFKKYRKLLKDGAISKLPWEDEQYIETLKLSDRDILNYKRALQLEADNMPPVLGTVTSFGTSFPQVATKGDLFLRVDQLPTVLYKFNGSGWMTVDKTLTDSYVYDDAYIDYLIDRIEQGQYDPDLLSDAEREQIAVKLTTQG